MSRTVIYTDQHAPDGRTIRYNVDKPTPEVAADVAIAIARDQFLAIPNEDGGDPIFVNPEHVASIAPQRED